MAMYVNECEGVIKIGNDLVELGFARAERGAVVSILDKTASYQFCRGGQGQRLLFRLALRRPEDRKIEWLDSRQATGFAWSKEETKEAVTLALTCSFAQRRVARGAPCYRNLKVLVKVRLSADSALSSWRMEVRGVEKAWMHQLICPILPGLVKVGESVSGETIVFPCQGEGYLFTNPFPVRDRLPLCAGPGPESPDVGVGELHGLYPGRIPMQMCACYNDHAGLYLATHDAGQNVKSFDVAPLGVFADRQAGMAGIKACRPCRPIGKNIADGQPVFSISHFPSEGPDQDVVLSYDTVVGVFHGDWYDAADIYRAWASKQWWCEKKLWDRDIPDWMRSGFGVFQMSNYHIPALKMNHPMGQIADVVNGFSKEIGAPLLTLVFNWEQAGAWTGPKGFFPPREGEAAFREAVHRLRKAGNQGFVYITGGCWYLKLPYDPPFDSWPAFETEGRPHAIKDVDGNIPVGRWYAGWESTRICAHTEYMRELTTSILLKCLDLGCTVVQIDNFPCGGSEACYDPSHGHPLGHGPWWSVAWGRLLAEARRKAKAQDPDCAITTEGISENFMPYLDMFDHRAGNMEYFGHYGRGMPMGGQPVPLFNYVYGEYIGAYCAAMPECNRPEVLYWTRCLGKALTQGVVPAGGWYFPEPAELNPVTIGFYKKVIRAAAQECWPYLMFGKMLRPPKIHAPTITASYCKFVLDDKRHYIDPKQRHEVQDRAVQHAVWQGRDRSIGYVFVNVSEDPVSFDVELSSYGLGARSYDVERIVDGVRELWLDGTALPRRERIAISPLSVLVLVVRER